MTNGHRNWNTDRVLVLLFLVLSLALALASLAHAAPCRPNGIDTTSRLNAGSAWEFFPMSGMAKTSSQSERDCLDLTALDELTQLIITAGDLAPTAKGKAITGALNLAFTRILVVAPYRGACQSPTGCVWIVPPQGRLYQEAQHGFDAFAYELTSTSHRAAAAARFASAPDLRNVLDVDAAFTPSGSAPFTLPGEPGGPPPPIVIAGRDDLFPITTKRRVPPCGNGDCSGLARVHAAHACVAAAKLAGLPTSGCASPQLEHVLYEIGCHGDERCEAFRRIAPFNGYVDVDNLTPTLIAIGLKLQDRDHLGWMQAQALGDWKASDLASIRHLLDHSMLNVADRRRLVVYPCDLGTVNDPAHGLITSFQNFGSCFGGKQSVQALLPKLAAAYGLGA